MLKSSKIYYLISTNINYYKKTLVKIIPSLRKISNKNIVITVSQCDYNRSLKIDDIKVFFVDYNSYEYTSLINAVENIFFCDYVFLLHDTMICGEKFLTLSRQIDYCDKVKLAHEKGWCNLGIYKLDYLIKNKDNLLSIKNISKQKAIQLEGKLFKEYSVYKNPSCHSSNERFTFYEKAKRNITYFRSVDVYKFGSNDSFLLNKGIIINEL